jgi:8-oxo-dGTP pyrophosphatase MutT (NUDIX family)
VRHKICYFASKYEPFDDKEKLDKEVILDYIKNNEDVLTRNNKIAHFTTSGWITNKERNKILMIHHNIYNSWAWVGGHADGDSDMLHVALKEAEEETGIKDIKALNDGKLASVEILTVDGHVKRGKYVSSHLHLNCSFILEADESQMLQIKEDENSGVKWVDIEESINLTNENKMKPIYKKLNDRIKELI